jgi:hypothetical protein
VRALLLLLLLLLLYAPTRARRVVRARSIAPPPGYTTLDSYVYVELPFPDAVALQKLQMKPPVAASLDPVYDWRVCATIERKKSFAKFCERRKVRRCSAHSCSARHVRALLGVL